MAVESEHSALATCAGASQTGLRAFTATSSHGLAYMHEMLHWCAGARLPIVLADVNRAMGSPWNIFADQSDSLVATGHGLNPVLLENNQEVLDTIIQAFRVAEQVLMPAMVCLDAFFLSHTSEPVAIPDQKLVDGYLPPFAPPYGLTPDDPRAFGGLPAGDGYMELRARMERSMQDAVGAAEVAAREYAETFGRYHPILESYHADGADLLLVTSGTIAGTARAVVDARREAGGGRHGEDPPLPPLPVRSGARRARRREEAGRHRPQPVVRPRRHHGVRGIRSALCNQPSAPMVFSYIAGLGGRDVTPAAIDDVVTATQAVERPESGTLWVGLKE